MATCGGFLFGSAIVFPPVSRMGKGPKANSATLLFL